jgi:ParB/RepB/Spo0J family partition protein
MLTPLAVQNADLLRVLATGQFPTKTELAAHLGRDLSNLNKTLARLEDEELIAGLEITSRAKACLMAFDVAAGKVAMPEGMVVLKHGQICAAQRQGADNDPLNPRIDWDSVEAHEDLASLRESILLRGVRQNLQVRPTADPETFEIIDGERRWRAVRQAISEGDLPADFPLVCLVKDVDDRELMLDATDANVQRRDLTEIEEGRQFCRLRDEFGVSTKEIAERISKSQKYVQNRIRLTELPAELQARMALPKDHLDHLGYKKALGEHLIEKRPPSAPKEESQPKLDISPAFGLALMELAHLAQRFPAKLSEPGFVEVVTISRGRYLSWLNDHKIITVRRESGRTFAKVLAYSSGALAWLEEHGFNSDADAAILAYRAEAISDRQRLAYTMDRYETGEIDECRLLNEEQHPVSAPGSEPRPASPATSTPKARATQADRDRATRAANDEARLQVLMRGLPEGRRDIINRAGDFITAFDASIRGRDEEQAALAAESYQACVAKLNGGTLFASEASDDKPGKHLRHLYKAQAGDEPRWGESGEFLLRVDGVVARVVIKGNLAHSTGVEFWATDLDQPFISNTGFTSGFLGFGARSMPSLDGAGVAVEVARLMRVRIAESKRLQMVDGEYLERRAAETAAAPWIAEALAAGAVLDGVAMIEAHEAEYHDENGGWAAQDEPDEASQVRLADHAGINARADERGISLVAALLRQSLSETQTHDEGRWNHRKDLDGLAQNAVWHVRNGDVGEALISLMALLHQSGEAGANEALQQHSQEKIVIGEDAHYTLGNAAVAAIPHLKAMVEAQRGRRLLPIDSDRTEKASVALERAASNLGFQP